MEPLIISSNSTSTTYIYKTQHTVLYYIQYLYIHHGRPDDTESRSSLFAISSGLSELDKSCLLATTRTTVEGGRSDDLIILHSSSFASSNRL